MATLETFELTASCTLDLLLKEIHRLGINQQSEEYQIVCAAIRNLRDRLGERETKQDGLSSEIFPPNVVCSRNFNSTLIEAEVSEEERESFKEVASSDDEFKAELFDTSLLKTESAEAEVFLKTEDIEMEGGTFTTKEELFSEGEVENTLGSSNEATVGLSRQDTSVLPTRRSSRRSKRTIQFENYEKPVSSYRTVISDAGSSQNQNPQENCQDRKSRGSSQDGNPRKNQRDLNELGLLHREKTPGSPTHVQAEILVDEKEVQSNLGEETWECPVCYEMFLEMHKCDEHIVREHDVPKLPCLECGQHFKTYHSLHQHNHSVKKNEVLSSTTALTILDHAKKYECPDCNIVFSSLNDCDAHLRKEHAGIPMIPCLKCGKRLQTYQSLRVHIQLHKTKSIHCSMCRKVFSGKTALSGHVRKVHMAKRNECSICSKSYKMAYKLRNHMAQEHGL